MQFPRENNVMKWYEVLGDRSLVSNEHFEIYGFAHVFACHAYYKKSPRTWILLVSGSQPTAAENYGYPLSRNHNYPISESYVALALEAMVSVISLDFASAVLVFLILSIGIYVPRYL